MSRGEILAIVPARGGSKGIPGKNLYNLKGRSLIFRAVRCALAAGVSRVVVSTDDPAMAEEGLRAGAEVPGLRPAELAQDLTRTSDVVQYLLDHLGVNPDFVMIVQPTTPLRLAEDLSGPWRRLAETPHMDGIAGVSLLDEPSPYKAAVPGPDGSLVPFHPMGILEGPRQALSPVYRFNGAVYVVRTRSFRQNGRLVPERTLPWPMPPERSINLDHPWDLILLEALVRRGLVDAVDY